MTINHNHIREDVVDEILHIRRRIHMNPELGNQEYDTAELIQHFLESIGIETRRYLDTAVVGILELEKPGKTVALRADIDALPVAETTGADYSSQNAGIMHACGHDVHTSALLGAAKLLAEARDELAGKIIFIFQPDEEGDGGARRLIAEGVLDGVDAVFGAHVAPDLPEGVVGIRYGKFYAASDTFDVVINGRASHGAQPEKGIDALTAAAAAVVQAKKIPENEADKCVISIGMLSAGTARNIIADRAEFSGIIRSLGEANRAHLRSKLEQTIENTCREYGAEATIRFKESYMGIVNTHAATAIAENAAMAAFGSSHVSIIEEPLMTTEDFGYYIDQCGSGSFYHIGAGCSVPLHAPNFLPTEKALLTAMRMHTAVARAYLMSQENESF